MPESTSTHASEIVKRCPINRRGTMAPTKQPRLHRAMLSSIPAILLFDHSKQKLAERERVLEGIGYRVLSASRLSGAKSKLQSAAAPFDFLVIGHLVPEEERTELSRLYRAHSREGHIIVFYQERVRNSAGAVTLLVEERSPDNLLETIKSLNLRETATNHSDSWRRL